MYQFIDLDCYHSKNYVLTAEEKEIISLLWKTMYDCDSKCP